MRSLAVLVLAMAACTEPTGGDEGPQTGRWLLDMAPNQGWFCTSNGVPCSAPAYFQPMPTEVEIGGGGALEWVGVIEHTGAVETACIRVPAGTDEGVARTEATFCNLIVDGVIDESRAFASIGWSPGTPDACTCSAHFDHVD